MDAGAYKNLILIEKCQIIEDELGNQTEQWIPFRKCYAYMNALSRKEYWEAAAVQQENVIEFVMRWKSFFDEMNTKQYRILHCRKVYNIKSIDNIQYANRTVKIRAVSDNES